MARVTVEDCIDKIPDKVLKVMQNKIAADIDAMVAFYNRNKELDIFFDSRYNYVRQCEIKKQVKTLEKIPENVKQYIPKEDAILEAMASRWTDSIVPINEKILDLEKAFQDVIENVSK